MILDLNKVAQRAARLMKLGGTPTMKILNRRRGRAFPHRGYFTIPQWAVKSHPAFAVAYVIHELAHFRRYPGGTIWFIRGHGRELRRIESETAEAFGLRLSYVGNKCYASKIMDLESKRVLCLDHGVIFIDDAECAHPACLI